MFICLLQSVIEKYIKNCFWHMKSWNIAYWYCIFLTSTACLLKKMQLPGCLSSDFNTIWDTYCISLKKKVSRRRGWDVERGRCVCVELLTLLFSFILSAWGPLNMPSKNLFSSQQTGKQLMQLWPRVLMPSWWVNSMLFWLRWKWRTAQRPPLPENPPADNTTNILSAIVKPLVGVDRSSDWGMQLN